MTASTLSFAPSALRAPRVSSARMDHWFKPQARPLERPAQAETGTARIDHWFRDQARAGQWSVQAAGSAAAPVVPGAEPSALRAWWMARRERRALARADAEMCALAIADPRMARDLQIARDVAEWKPQA